jgi:hypothetical protein
MVWTLYELGSALVCLAFAIMWWRTTPEQRPIRSESEVVRRIDQRIAALALHRELLLAEAAL